MWILSTMANEIKARIHHTHNLRHGHVHAIKHNGVNLPAKGAKILGKYSRVYCKINIATVVVEHYPWTKSIS